MNGRRWIFLDKDGTLVEDVPYNVDPGKIVLKPGVERGLARLHAAGYRFVVVSNQSGVARGVISPEALSGVENHLRMLLRGQIGVEPVAFYWCPHHPEGSVRAYAVECDCRKPKPGMLLAAARDLGIPLAEAWMIGDILNDVEAGKRAGCRAILIDNGGETEWLPGPFRRPDFTAQNFDEAAQMILAEGQDESAGVGASGDRKSNGDRKEYGDTQP
jgi:histidinol-phosphate phosphatase family protein